jgi:hypothetical protein
MIVKPYFILVILPSYIRQDSVFSFLIKKRIILKTTERN